MQWKSWALYHSMLDHPALTYPVLERTQVAPSQAPRRLRKPSRLRTRGYNPMLGGGCVIMILLCLTNLTGVFLIFFSQIETFLTLIVLGILFLSTIAPGFNLAMKVSGAIYNEQAKGRYDLLALMPRGAAALHWALAIKCNRRDRLANTMRHLVLNFGLWLSLPTAAVLIPLLIIGLILVLMDASSTSVIFFTAVSLPFIVLMAYYIDYLQSSVIAFLISVIVPAWLTSRSRVWMSWVAPLSFLALQLLSYMLFWIVFLRFNAGIWGSTTHQGETSIFFSPLLFFALIIGIREAVVLGLWRWAVALFGDDLRSLRLD